MTCHRFGLRRLDAAVFHWILVNRGRDRSQPTKALTGQRTPKRGLESEPVPKVHEWLLLNGLWFWDNCAIHLYALSLDFEYREI